MKKVLITRSMPEALELAQHIKVLGCLPVIEPLFTVELVSPQCPATGEVQAFIVTSRNAVRAIAAQVDKSVTLYAVGEKTATLARSMGFTRIYTAKGTVDDLIKLILSKINPHKGKVIYFSGEIIKRDIGKVLKEQEIECERIVSYRTVPCLHLTEEVIGQIFENQINTALFFSGETLRHFIRLIRSSKLALSLKRIECLCLSTRVAEEAEKIKWAKIWIARKPTTKALLEYFL